MNLQAYRKLPVYKPVEHGPDDWYMIYYWGPCPGCRVEEVTSWIKYPNIAHLDRTARCDVNGCASTTSILREEKVYYVSKTATT